MSDLPRRTLLCATLLSTVSARAAGPTTVWDFALPSLDGGTLDFASFKGRVLLVVNTASFCGFTYQYEALEKLHRDFSPRGLTVIGVPSQDFDQESDSSVKVKQFCELTYGVEFPMTEIAHVRGSHAIPFYAWVRDTQGGWQPDWNFNKALIGRDGLVKATYRSGAEPGAPAIMQPLDQELRRARA